jgi:hypothetical protein
MEEGRTGNDAALFMDVFRFAALGAWGISMAPRLCPPLQR